MNDKEFEKWLIREEAILKVSKEVNDWCENDVFVDELYKRYRQLEKDNSELLAALKPFRDMNKCFRPKMILAQMAGDFYRAGEVYTKHKGD